MSGIGMEAAHALARRVESFVREVVIPFEADQRRDHHGGPADELVAELKEKARAAGVLTPHVIPDGGHLTQRETAAVLTATGLSPLGPLACNTAAPDEGNMYLLSKVGSAAIRERFLSPLVDGRKRSCFFMTEPADLQGAGSDPSMMITTCRRDGNHWTVNGQKCFSTGADGAGVGIVVARSEEEDGKGGACMFLVDLPDPAIRITHVPNTIDSSMPGGHCEVTIENLRIPADQMLGDAGEGFKYAQVRLSPARLLHCMRWLGACRRANEIATDYANRRMAFGKVLIDHEGVGFMLAENMIDLKQAELMIDWCAEVLDSGSLAVPESSMAKVAVSEALMRVADRCVQVMGGTGVTDKTIVEQVFREIRAFRIYDGPTEVHKWSLAKKIKRDWGKFMQADGRHPPRVESIAEANKGVGEVRAPLDTDRLSAWLGRNVEGFVGPLEVAQFNGGQSNPTYRLQTPTARYVLRRKPPGEVLKGAHDVLREARVQQALAGSGVPVARILGVCSDQTVVGSDFYVMEMVEGRVFWDAAFREVPLAGRAAYYDEMNRVIAALHGVDHVAAGLGDYGKPGNYFARQIGRWSKQYLEDELAGRDADMDALVRWLPTAIPEGDETRIVHGDFRCDNMIFHPTEPRILAVLDWELSTLGHPVADFAYHAMMYRMPPDIVAGLGGADPVALGLPTEAEYIARYCQRTGRAGIADWDFYIAFQFFRLAAIFHGIKGRVLRGTASNAQAALRAEAFPRLARLAREAMEACR